MANFPNSPVAGTTYLVGGKNWRYDADGVFRPVVSARIRYYTSIAAMQAVSNPAGTICFCDGATSGTPQHQLQFYSKGTGFGTPSNGVDFADSGGNFLERMYTLLDADTVGGRANMIAESLASNAAPAGKQFSYALPRNSALFVGQIRVWHGSGGDWTTGSNNNLSIGQLSMDNNTGGYANTAIGYEAMNLNTSGINNTAIGKAALRRNQSGSDSVAIGVDALAFATASRNTAIGRSAGDTLTSGSFNTAIGYKAMQGPTGATGSGLNYNTAIGDNALTSLAVGNNNIAIGFQAGLCETNLGVGSNASNNVWVGTSAGRDTTTAQASAAVGYNALLLNRSGVGHTVLGYNACSAITASTGNTALGYEALRDSTVGLNTAVGYLAMATNTSFTNSSALGANAAVTGNSQVQLGDSATTTYVYGTVQNRSDERDKADIKDTELGLAFIESLRPVDYKWDLREDYRTAGESLSDVQKDGSKKRSRFHHGFIAQELPESFGGVQDHKVSGGDDVMSVGYDEFIAPMVKAIQELSAKVAELEAKLGKR